MGLLRRLFGATPRGPPSEPATYPFAGEIRMYHEEYERLATGWWKVEIHSAEEWAAKLVNMEEAIRSHYGYFQRKDGQVVPRWNERTWEGVREGLVIEKR